MPQLAKWFRLGSEYLGAQLVIRATSAAGALLLVNVMPRSEYGIYTLLLANLAFLTSLSDFGATGSLLFFWRRARKRAYVFSAYLEAVVRLRKLLFGGSTMIGATYLLYMVLNKNPGSVTIALSSIPMFLAAWYTIKAATWVYVFRIEGKYRQSYVVEGVSEFVKLMSALVLWWTGMVYGWAAIGGVFAGAFFSAQMAGIYVRKRDAKRQNHSARVALRADLAVRAQTIPTIPWTLFFALQGPFVAWLAATFGSVVNLAEVGALGRLGAILSIISGFTVSVLVPKLSHINDERQYLRYYLAWFGILFSIGSGILSLVWLWPNALLLLLGNQYNGLASELFITSATAIVMTFEYFGGAVNRARGWMQGQGLRIGFIAAGQIAILPFMDFSVTADLLLFGLGTALLAMIVQLGFNLAGLLRVHQVSVAIIALKQKDSKKGDE
jgi:hypothetical protein